MFSGDIKRRIFLPVVLSLVVILVGAITGAWWLEREHLQTTFQTDCAQFQTQLDWEINETSHLLLAILTNLERNPGLVRAYLADDRDQLQQQAQPIFAHLQKNFHIAQFFFIDTDLINFLRVHEPEHWGDQIEQLTLDQAAQTGRDAAGVEMGPTGALLLRVVHPWRDEKRQLLGYLEIGMELRHIIRTVHHTMGVNISVLTDKSHLVRPLWERSMAELKSPAWWDQFPRQVLVSSTVPEIPPPVQKILRKGAQIPGDRPLSFTWRRQDYILMRQTLRDEAGQPVAYVLMYKDVSAIHATSWELVRAVAALCLILAGGLSLFFFFLLRRLQNRLDVAQESLLRESRALRESEQNQAVTLRSIGDALIATDAAGRVTRMNPAAQRLTGWPLAEALGRPLAEVFRIIQEKTRQPVEDPYATVMRTGAGINLTDCTLLLARDKREIPIADSAAPIHADAGGPILGVVVVFRDQTRERVAEQALRDSEEKFRIIADAAYDGVAMIDGAGNVIHWNPAAEKIFGYHKEEILGRNLHQILMPGRYRVAYNRAFPLFRQTGTGAAVGRVVQLEGMHKDGREIPVELSVSAIDLHGQWGAVAIIRDITERRQNEQKLRNAQKRLTAVLEGIADPTLVVDCNYHVVMTNQALRDLLGVPGEAPPAQTACFQLLGRVNKPCTADDGICPLKEIMRTRAPVKTLRTIQNAQGRTRILEVVASPICDETGAVELVVESCRDMTEIKQAEEALRASEQRYMLVAEGANDGLWDYDTKLDHVYFSPRFQALLGYGDQDRLTRLEDWFSRVHQADQGQLQADVALLFEGRSTQFQNEHRVLYKAGEYRWVLCRGVAQRDAAGKVQRIAGSLSDIHEQKLMEQQLIHDALHDKVTGLANRRMFLQNLDRAIQVHRRDARRSFAVLFLDFDGFKRVNDSLGHELGDLFLIEAGRRLTVAAAAQHAQAFPSCPTPVVARLGGDEFALLLEGVKSVPAAVDLANRLLRDLAQPYQLKGYDVATSASIGIADSTGAYTSPDEVLRDADTAMYRAKNRGKNCFVVFDQRMHEEVQVSLEVENDLRRAVDRQELRLLYQPIILLEDAGLIGFEALIRWNHPRLGLMTPDRFLPLAEETGLIIPIGHWVMREACRQLHLWQRQFPREKPLCMTINLARKQVLDPHLADDLRDILTEYPLAPRSFQVEVTETVLMGDTRAVLAGLDRLKKFGVQLLMDNFGIGQSSLSRLNEFPIDAVKIDRSFVTRMLANRNLSAIIQAIITLAHNLDLRVIAAGVETDAQVAELQTLDCNCAQGYFFAHPLTSAAAQQLLTQGRLLPHAPSSP